MTWTKWFHNTQQLTTADGKTVQVWEFLHQPDATVLSDWATHFRNHYCSDDEIDGLLRSPSDTRAAFLNEIKFPDQNKGLGPATRAGDFAEILVADFIQYIWPYWVPRTRYDRKTTRNSSTPGSDVIGLYFVKNGVISPQDELAIFESKTRFSKQSTKPLLQDAVNHSKKDPIRVPESLSAIKQRLIDRGQHAEAERVKRFQTPVDQPYKEIYGAVALFDNRSFNAGLESTTNSSAHPHSENLVMIVIKGNDMMPLVHALYERAANEA